ncbi:hemolysin family protein [Aquamicrobium segne]|uniref:Hemolysin family protein n=1 Tax=Aquamicrobium segne TaxID=469547 RepID=A0ABW0GXF6_9HYPH
MNDTPHTAHDHEAGPSRDVPENSDEDPSRSIASGAAQADAAPIGPGFFQKLISLLKPKNGGNLREEIVDALAETHTEAEGFSPGERAMLNNILRLREVRVEDVMVPRADIEAVESGTTLAELLSVFEQSGHSRMPVYFETLDDPRGMVHIRDLLGYITRSARGKKRRSTRKPAPPEPLDLAQVDLTRTIAELNLMRPVLFVPPSMLASDLMGRMQAARIQMALVIDEYGGTDGLASLEDIVEMVVGDIEDEHDDEAPLITKAGEGVLVVDGKAEIEEVQAMVGEDFAPGEHGESVDTIGGMIFNTLGRVPARGEVVQAIPGFEFHVLDADPRRIKRVRIVQLAKGERRKRVVRAEQS